MKTPLIPIVVAVLLLAVFLYLDWKKKRYAVDLQFPAPTTKRTDLLYFYYGSMGEQVAETRDHINMHMESQFDGPDRAIQNMRDAGVPTMLIVTYQLFTPKLPGEYIKVRADAYERLYAFFKLLQENGVLDKVRYIYPVDEPNNTVGNVGELMIAVSVIRAVAQSFPELDGYKLAVIYAADKPFIGQELFDLVGFDDYDMKSHVLVSAKYTALKASLLPHQKIIIVPGGAYDQDPVPFVNFAQSNPEVGAVMPFLWYDDTMGNVGRPGIRSNANKEQYTAAGKYITQ